MSEACKHWNVVRVRAAGYGAYQCPDCGMRGDGFNGPWFNEAWQVRHPKLAVMLGLGEDQEEKQVLPVHKRPRKTT